LILALTCSTAIRKDALALLITQLSHIDFKD
jgi:hypothetical protein